MLINLGPHDLGNGSADFLTSNAAAHLHLRKELQLPRQPFARLPAHQHLALCVAGDAVAPDDMLTSDRPLKSDTEVALLLQIINAEEEASWHKNSGRYSQRNAALPCVQNMVISAGQRRL